MASTEIFLDRGRWGHDLAWSAALHVGVTVAIVAYAWVATGRNGSNWGAGGGGSAMGVSLVSNVPLPANPVQTQNVLANGIEGTIASRSRSR